MLRLLKRRRTVAEPVAPIREDLRIRNLLDDPGLRRAMGLDLDRDRGDSALSCDRRPARDGTGPTGGRVRRRTLRPVAA